MGLEDVLDAAAVAKKLEISVSAVHRLCRRGTLPSGWLAGRRVWTRAQIDSYLKDAEAQRRRPNSGTIHLGGRDLSTEDAIDHMKGVVNG